MKKLSIASIQSALLALLLVCSFSTLSAQTPSKYVRAGGVVLDDGAGHSVTLLPPTSGTAATLPLPSNTPSTGDVLTATSSGGATWQAAGAGSAFSPAYVNATFVGFQNVSPGSSVYIGAVGLNNGFTTNGQLFTVPATGIYSVEYSVTPTSASTFELFVNGLGKNETIFSASTANAEIHGAADLSLVAADVVELKNVSSSSINLASSPSNNVTASLRINQMH